MIRRLALSLASLAFAGCAMVGPDYQRPAVDLPDSYPEPAAEAAKRVLPSDWWKLYKDRTLDQLVEKGLQKNADVRLAIARIEEAEAVLREAGATYFPLVQGTAQGTRSRASTAGAVPVPAGARVRSDLQLTASTSFELDFWGRLRRAEEAARAQYAASAYGRDVVALTLAAAVAQTYFAVRSLDAQISVAEETVQTSAESLGIVRRRAAAGLVSDLDVNQAEAAQAQVAAQLKDLRRQRAAALHQLGALSGMLDLKLEPRDIRALPSPPLPPPGLPSRLLERRPDVRQAEAQLAAANALIGVARAAQLPTFSLTGLIGLQSRELSNLVSASAGIGSIGLAVAAPIFDAGRYAARSEQAEARQRQAAAAYQKSAETAFREVSDALSNTAYVAEAEQDLRETVERARSTLRLARIRYDSGYSGYLAVLDAQRTLNDAQLALVRNRQAYLAYSVDLMKALGGGWSAP
ncbi:MAG: hypothetical protein A3G27_18305 [Betaproteobacteria bacterium RIFCSPLOWO2_12_FULL_66_14]|nr:MAG: hypothetical protein A3G27_18305 [Betaproteobacteria bacterium RIFCSPLOWO2_12_FULL_66_14]